MTKSNKTIAASNINISVLETAFHSSNHVFDLLVLFIIALFFDGILIDSMYFFYNEMGNRFITERQTDTDF